ncbi:MAG: FHA domain-containing protein [Bryobacteraceae bacterium]
MKAVGEAQGKISGRIIIDQLIRNMELGQFELGYSILTPCIFSLYLHPDDYARLTGVFDLIREDARKGLAARLAELNAKPLGGMTLALGAWRGAKDRKPYKIACRDFSFEFFPDSEGVVPLGDVEIHSELNETPQPGYHGIKTTLLDREPGVGANTGRTGGTRPGIGPDTRRLDEPAEEAAGDRVYAEIRYEDDSGAQLFLMTQDEISIGRGGDGAQVSLALYTNDEVSREHLRVRRDAAHKRFLIVDNSMNGTWLNGKRLARGVEQTLPPKSQISVAEVITLQFEARS